MFRDVFYKYFPDLLCGIYFRLGIRLVPEGKYPIDAGGVKKICVFAATDIGNVTALMPMLQSLRHGIPDARITIVVLPNGAKDVIEGSDLVDEIVVLDDGRKIKNIRDNWPDLTIDAAHEGFTSAKEAFRTGALWKLGFRYDHRNRSNTGFLYTHSVPLDESKHEVEQNLDLIRSLGLPVLSAKQINKGRTSCF